MRRGKLVWGVASRVSDCVVASRVWGGWVDVKNKLFFSGCVVRLLASSLLLRFGASKVWGWVGEC